MTIKPLFKILIISILCLVSFQSIAQDLHRKNTDLPCIDKNFNVAVHITVDSLLREPIISEEEVNDMMVEVSAFFSPICASFSVCEFIVIENNYSYSNLQDAPLPIEQRIEKTTALFNYERRINLYIVNHMQNIDCGFGTMEGILTEKSANIFIKLKNCSDVKHSQNIAHQLGHLFGLYDTFNLEADLELVDGSNCETAGDFICDTPADPYGRIIPIEGEEDVFLVGNFQANCEFIFNGKDENGEYWQPDMGNIMSSYPCKCGFTREQYFKMVETYNSSPFKQF